MTRRQHEDGDCGTLCPWCAEDDADAARAEQREPEDG
jgi:hypothetical protein